MSGLADFWRDAPARLELPPDLPFEEWEELGRVLQTIEHCVMWWWGDWLNYGHKRYGDRAFQAVATGYAVNTLQAASWVAKQVPPAQRDPDLSFSHHRVVASLAPETRRQLLKEAKEEHLTVRQLHVKAQAEHSKAIHDREREIVEATPPEERKAWPVLVAEPPWRDVSLSDLCDWPVPAALNCVVFLWTTVNHLADGLTLLDAWGMRYRSHLVWPGPGAEEQNNAFVILEHQIVLIGTKGDLPPKDRPPSLNAFPGPPGYAARVKLLDIIEAMYPDMPRADVFAKELVLT